MAKHVTLPQPQSALNTPQPLTLAGDLKRVLHNLTQSGLPKEAPVFYGGHSLGGAMVQQVVAGGKAPFDKAAGQMLYGAALLRNVQGTDITRAFHNVRHSARAYAWLQEQCVGVLRKK